VRAKMQRVVGKEVDRDLVAGESLPKLRLIYAAVKQTSAAPSPGRVRDLKPL
jgi:hypothetical protein